MRDDNAAMEVFAGITNAIMKGWYDIMKMTSEQIGELNELLVDHSEVLTAFYDEGIRYGLKRGATLVIAGAALAALVSCEIEVMKTRRRKTKEIES